MTHLGVLILEGKWTLGDLNPWHLRCKRSTLPTELNAPVIQPVSASLLSLHIKHSAFSNAMIGNCQLLDEVNGCISIWTHTNTGARNSHQRLKFSNIILCCCWKCFEPNSIRISLLCNLQPFAQRMTWESRH